MAKDFTKEENRLRKRLQRERKYAREGRVPTKNPNGHPLDCQCYDCLYPPTYGDPEPRVLRDPNLVSDIR